MTRHSVKKVLEDLARSSNPEAAGIALCLKALDNLPVKPPAYPLLVTVTEAKNMKSRSKLYGRDHLAQMGVSVR